MHTLYPLEAREFPSTFISFLYLSVVLRLCFYIPSCGQSSRCREGIYPNPRPFALTSKMLIKGRSQEMMKIYQIISFEKSTPDICLEEMVDQL